MQTRRTVAPASPLTQSRRIVVKVGSALLVDDATGRLNRAWLETLTEDLVRLRKRGQEIILVSSGAIALGRRHLGLAPGLCGEESQAAAAVGQTRLAHAYKELFEAHGVTVARCCSRSRTASAGDATSTPGQPARAARLGALPVINENDTVATAEIRYGDNDRLARVAQMASADWLLLQLTSTVSTPPTPGRMQTRHSSIACRVTAAMGQAGAAVSTSDREAWRRDCGRKIALGGRAYRRRCAQEPCAPDRRRGSFLVRAAGQP